MKTADEKVGYLDPDAKNRRPEFGSLIVSLLGMFPAVLLIRLGGAFRTSLGVLPAFESTDSLLFGVDLWSIWRMLQWRVRHTITAKIEANHRNRKQGSFWASTIQTLNLLQHYPFQFHCCKAGIIE